MCLAIPMKIVERDSERALVETGGARREILLTLVPHASVGDWVIVHTGYALEVLDETEAQRTLQLLKDIGESGE